MAFQSPVQPRGVVKVSVFVLAGRPSVVWFKAVHVSDFLPVRRSANVYMSSPHADTALTGCVLSVCVLPVETAFVSVMSLLGRSPKIPKIPTILLSSESF